MLRHRHRAVQVVTRRDHRNSGAGLSPATLLSQCMSQIEQISFGLRADLPHLSGMFCTDSRLLRGAVQLPSPLLKKISGGYLWEHFPIYCILNGSDQFCNILSFFSAGLEISIKTQLLYQRFNALTAGALPSPIYACCHQELLRWGNRVAFVYTY